MKYYSSELPEVGNIVFINYLKPSDTGLGVYVELVEYDNIEGLILGTDIGPGKWAVRPEKIFNQNKSYPCYVMAVNKEKKTIDLSYKKVQKEKKEIYEKNFIFIQKLYKIYESLEKLKLVENSELFSWTFEKLISNSTLQQEINVEEIYTKVLQDPVLFFHKFHPFNDHIEKFILHIKSKTNITPAELFINFSMSILESDAVKKINEILTFDDTAVRVCYMSPKYRIYITHQTIEMCKEYAEKVKLQIKERLAKYSYTLLFDEDVNVLRENEIRFI